MNRLYLALAALLFTAALTAAPAESPRCICQVTGVCDCGPSCDCGDQLATKLHGRPAVVKRSLTTRVRAFTPRALFFRLRLR